MATVTKDCGPLKIIDWASLSQQAVSYSLDLLAQFSGSGADPYSFQLGLILSKAFKLPSRGQRNIANALGNLPLYRQSDDDLVFGFATRCLVRHPTFNLCGNPYIALIGCILEHYDEDACSQIGYEFFHELGAPAELVPPLQQLKNVNHTLNGALATTGFGLLLEQYIQLSLTRRHTFPSEMSANADVKRSHAQIHQVTNALQAVASVSHGHCARINIRGFDDAMWCAAIAEWLFDLRVHVVSADAGEVLHSSCEENEPQVMVILGPVPTDAIMSNLKISKDVPTFDISGPEDGAESVITDPSFMAVGGRVRWEILLRTVFGKSFTSMLSIDGNALGTAIGSSIAILAELASDSVNDFMSSLLISITNWLPELRRVSGRMEVSTKLAFREARKSYRKSIHTLRTACVCPNCKWAPESQPASRDDRTARSMSSSSSSSTLVTGNFCIVTIVETIVSLGLLLSRCRVSAELYPKRLGIVTFYDHLAAKNPISPFATSTPTANHTDLRTFHNTYHEYLDTSSTSNLSVLNVCSEIFTGTSSPSMPDDVLAFSRGGICVYPVWLEGDLLRLQTRSQDKKMIRVVNGRIHYLGKEFDYIRDGVGDISRGPNAPKTSLQELVFAEHAQKDVAVTLREQGGEHPGLVVRLRES